MNSYRVSECVIIRALKYCVMCKGAAPEAEPGISREEASRAKALWATKIESVASVTHTVDMNNISSCIDCKARLVQDVYGSVEIQVCIR